MAYLDAAKIAAIVRVIGPASLRRQMLNTILPEIATAIATDAAAPLAAMPAVPGVAEALKLVQLDANLAVDVVRTASLMLGASGAEVAVTATAGEINQLAGTDFAAEFAQLEGLEAEFAALAGMDPELALLNGLTVGSAVLNALISNPGRRAINILYVPDASNADGDTVTIGADVYELDTHVVETITPGNIRVNVSGGTTAFSQGTLTIGVVQPLAGDTMTIGAKVYTFVPDGTGNADGEIDIGVDVAECRLNIAGAINGVAPQAHNVAHTLVTAGAFIANDLIITALEGGVAGDLIATTETFTDAGNFFDAATLGTTTAGVDPTAAEVTDALIATINLSATELVTAVDIGTTEILLVADAVGAITIACTETFTGAASVWAAANMFGGAAAAGISAVAQSRVPVATEVTLGNMHFMFDFTPTFVAVQVRTTATGAVVAWDGALTITGGQVSLDNSGAVDWSVAETVSVLAYA